MSRSSGSADVVGWYHAPRTCRLRQGGDGRLDPPASFPRANPVASADVDDAHHREGIPTTSANVRSIVDRSTWRKKEEHPRTSTREGRRYEPGNYEWRETKHAWEERGEPRHPIRLSMDDGWTEDSMCAREGGMDSMGTTWSEETWIEQPHARA